MCYVVPGRAGRRAKLLHKRHKSIFMPDPNGAKFSNRDKPSLLYCSSPCCTEIYEKGLGADRKRG